MRRVAGLLLSAVRAGDVDRQRRAPAPSSSGAAARAAARRSAANAGSVMSTAELTRLTQTCQLYNKGAYMSIIRLTSVILCNFSFFLTVPCIDGWISSVFTRSVVFTCIGALGTPSRTGPLVRKYLRHYFAITSLSTDLPKNSMG